MPVDMPELPTEFYSERLLLRRYRPGDSAEYFEMLQTNREHLLSSCLQT